MCGPGLLAGVSDRQLRDFERRATEPVIKGHAAFHSRQHEQLFEDPVQTIRADLGLGQCPFRGIALGHGRHLQVGLDGGQRAAQFMGGVIGQPAFAFEHVRDPREQLVLGFDQGRQLSRQSLDVQRLHRVGAALRQGRADSSERR